MRTSAKEKRKDQCEQVWQNVHEKNCEEEEKKGKKKHRKAQVDPEQMKKDKIKEAEDAFWQAIARKESEDGAEDNGDGGMDGGDDHPSGGEDGGEDGGEGDGGEKE